MLALQATQFEAPAPLPAGSATLDEVTDGVRRLLDVFVMHGFCTKVTFTGSVGTSFLLADDSFGRHATQIRWVC